MKGFSKCKKTLLLALCLSMVFVFSVPSITYAAVDLSGVSSAAGEVFHATGKTTAKLKVRKAPSSDADVIINFAASQTVYIIDKNYAQGWYKVYFGYSGKGYVGYVMSQYVTSVKDQSLTVAPSNTKYAVSIIKNVPAKDSGVAIASSATSKVMIGSLSNGDSVNVIDYNATSSRAKIYYSGYIGYVSKYNIKEVTANSVISRFTVSKIPEIAEGGALPTAFTSGTVGVVVKSVNWNTDTIKAGTTYTLTVVAETTNGNTFNTGKDGTKGYFGSRTAKIKSVTSDSITIYAYVKAKEVPPASYGEDVAFDGGSGTKADPYLISTPEQLNAVRFHLKNSFKLTKNIDLSSWGQWLPIGADISYNIGKNAGTNQGNFQGVFDGNGYYIKGMTIKINQEEPYLCESAIDRQQFGLFSYVEGTSRKNDGIKNLGMVDSRIDVKYTRATGRIMCYFGNFCGGANKTSFVKCWTKNCKMTVDIKKGPIGGSVGNDPTVIYGGIVATGEELCITDCGNNGSFTGSKTFPKSNMQELGGIIGVGQILYITRCFNIGSITMPNTKSNTSYIGGIIGNVYSPFESNNNAYITDCYNTGKLTGAGMRGGIFGYAGGRVPMTRCYNIGKLSTAGKRGQIYAYCFRKCNMSTCYTKGNSVSGKAWTKLKGYSHKTLKAMPESKIK